MIRVSVPAAMLAAMLVIGATVVAIRGDPSATAERTGHGVSLGESDSTDESPHAIKVTIAIVTKPNEGRRKRNWA